MSIIEKSILKFKAFIFLYCAMILSVSGMYTMYIQHLGFSKKEVSIAVTIYTISVLIGQNFIGFLVDKFRFMKGIIFGAISIGIIVPIGFNFANAHWHIYLLIFVWGFFVNSSTSISETWCIDTLKSYNQQRNFGRIRGFGSIGYGLSGALLGSLLQRFGWNIYHWYIIMSIIFTLLMILMMSDTDSFSMNRPKENISIKEAFREIFKIKPLITMIAIIFMYTFVVKGIYSYLGVLISDYGGGAASLGFTYFFDATPEVITFFLAASLLKRFKSKNLVFAAFLIQVVRLTVILIFNNAMAVMLMGILSGFAFGLLASSYKTYIYDLAPAKYKTSCMSIAETIIGLSGIISVPIFGFIFTKFGTNTAVAFGLIIYVVMILIMLLSAIRAKREPRILK